MVVLLLFAFLAGIMTVLSPCIIPLLPLLLAAGSGKGVYRPLGIVVGLIVSFSFFTLTLAALVQWTGISTDFLRNVAITILCVFGVIMIFPRLGDLFAKWTSRFSQWGDTVSRKKQHLPPGFISGFIEGLALGLIWTPCAGPILGAVTTLVISKKVSFAAILLTLTYSIGAAIPMFLIAYGESRALTASRFLAKHSKGIRQVFGVVMILSAIALSTGFLEKIQDKFLRIIPYFSIEDNTLVKKELQKIGNFSYQEKVILEDLGTAPELQATGWLNSPPLTLSMFRGKVVLLDFWSYTCVYCVRGLPLLEDWSKRYQNQGLVVIGIHTPQYEFQKLTENVEGAVQEYKITFPVAIDNDYKIWVSYHNSAWPTRCLIDKRGHLRLTHIGAGDDDKIEQAFKTLLNE